MTITEQSSFNVFFFNNLPLSPGQTTENGHEQPRKTQLDYIYNYIYNYIYTRDHTGLFEHLAPPNPMVWSSLAPFNDDFRVPIFGETKHGWKTNSNRQINDFPMIKHLDRGYPGQPWLTTEEYQYETDNVHPGMMILFVLTNIQSMS